MRAIWILTIDVGLAGQGQVLEEGEGTDEVEDL